MNSELELEFASAPCPPKSLPCTRDAMTCSVQLADWREEARDEP